MIKLFYVYRIVNKINKKKYVGITSLQNPKERFISGHIQDSNREKPKSVIGKAIKKYGKSKFKFEVIYKTHSEKECLDMEKYFISKYNTYLGEGYNCAPGGAGLKVKPGTRKWLLIDSKGVLYDNIINLKEFARFHSLNSSALYKVARRKREQHKGWICRELMK